MNSGNIDDGEIHALSDNYAYILKYISCEKSKDEFDEFDKSNPIIQDNIIDFYKKYIDYLIEFDKEKIVDHLINYFCFNSSEIKFIFRPPWVVSCLSQKCSLALKFKRVKKDNLEIGK
jgi:hypothetical protein